METTLIETTDPINARILAVSEDKLQGFIPDPLALIAHLTGLPVGQVGERIVAMLQSGTIRRVRQTLMSINLARGALVAWRVPPEKLNSAFDFMWEQDPFSGHIVIRSTDRETPGSQYRLWTTVKVPDGYSMEKHCQLLCRKTRAEAFKLMPANRVFALGVGHVRRRGMEPGSKSDVLAEPHDTQYVHLTDHEWKVLTALKREFTPEELQRAVSRSVASSRLHPITTSPHPAADASKFWQDRATEAGVPLEEFLRVAGSLHDRKVIGRFSTFLEHVKPNAAGERVTQYNALFHWAVPKGREMEAGQQVGRFHIMTHCYWREGGAEFNHVNIMGVAHGTDRDRVLAHKAAIDAHLATPDGGSIPVSYTNVFWGGRSEIKPSEISPFAYADWCQNMGADPQAMKQRGTETSSEIESSVH